MQSASCVLVQYTVYAVPVMVGLPRNIVETTDVKEGRCHKIANIKPHKCARLPYLSNTKYQALWKHLHRKFPLVSTTRSEVLYRTGNSAQNGRHTLP